jgi:hypothetical protein
MTWLADRLGTRFLVVSVLPTGFLVLVIGGLVAAGAPGREPTWSRMLRSVDRLNVRETILLVVVVLVLAVVTHPLQVPLVQLLEGHWGALPFGEALAASAVARVREQKRGVRTAMRQMQSVPAPRPWVVEQRLAAVRETDLWLPDESSLLPTVLGNTLRAGERRAGRAYGLDLTTAIDRLYPLLPDKLAEELSDRRNQLDAAVRLCVNAGVATVVTVVLLMPYGKWLLVSLTTYAVCWASYAGAVAAARAFCRGLAAAVDWSHLPLYDALQLERPVNMKEEKETGEALSRLFRGSVLAPAKRSFCVTGGRIKLRTQSRRREPRPATRR